MPRIFRNRVGTTKLSLFVMSVAVLALFCFAAVPSASAQTTESFYLNIVDSGGSIADPIPSDAVLVTVSLNAAKNIATVTFAAQTQNGDYLGYKTIISVHDVGTVTTTIQGTSADGTISIDAFSSNPTLDGFGFGTSNDVETNLTSAAGTDVTTGGYTPTAAPTSGGNDIPFSQIVFTLTTTSTWSNVSSVLANTSAMSPLTVNVAAQVGTGATAVGPTNNDEAEDTRDDGGLQGENVPAPTPEPMSYLLFGSGLLLLGVISRKKLGLSRG